MDKIPGIDHGYLGIDYGFKQTNICFKTGIRFGVIPMNDLADGCYESFEAVWGDPTCPECGGEGITPITELSDDISFEADFTKDYACEACQKCFSSEDCFPESPAAQKYEGEGYKAFAGEDGDIFIEMSPFCTYAQFCSPCAPGACHLRNALTVEEVENFEKANACLPNNNRCYCFGHDWFEEGKAPYPVYDAKTGKLVPPFEK